MWHAIPVGEQVFKHVKTDESGRVTGRVMLGVAEHTGEHGASQLVLNDEGIGKFVFKGWFITLDQAKAAVDA